MKSNEKHEFVHILSFVQCRSYGQDA